MSDQFSAVPWRKSDSKDPVCVEIGRRLRRARVQALVSLMDIQKLTGGEWGAVRLSSYERGERSVSAANIVRLAALYGVPVSQFLPEMIKPSIPLEELISQMRAERAGKDS